MRRICCLAVLSLALAAGPAAAEQELGVLTFDLGSETSRRVTQAARAAALDKGWEVEIEDAAGDVAAGNARLEAMAQAGLDAVLLVAGPAAELAAGLAAVGRAGIPAVSVLSGISPFTAFDVAVNPYEIGARLGLYLLGAMNHDGGLLMARADSRPETRIRARVMELILDENRGVELADARDLDPFRIPPGPLRAEIGGWLAQRGPRIEAIWTATHIQAFLIDDLLRAAGAQRGDILLTTVGGGQEAFRRLRDPGSLLTATVVVPYELMGEAGVDALGDLLAGTPREQITAGPQLLMDAVLVDRINVPPDDVWPW